MRSTANWSFVRVCGHWVIGHLATIVVILASARLAEAQLYTLVDDFSQLDVNTSAQATIYNWTIAGVPHLQEISNWYRVGNTGPERSVHTLNVSPGILSDQDSDNTNETVSVPYADPLGRFAMVIDYAVFSGPPGSLSGSFDETVRITNLQTTPLTFHFFEYIDLDLYASPNDDTVQMTSPTSVTQFDPLTVGNWGFAADRFEFDNFVGTSNTLAKLSDPTNTDNLSNLNSGFPVGSGPVGPGNVSWALQFDFGGPGSTRPPIPPGQTVVITKEGLLQMLVPEPSGSALAVLSGLALLPLRRRRVGRSAPEMLCCCGAVVTLLATVSTATADDLSPPNWARRTPLTTVQEWEFLHNAPPATPLPPDGATPGISPFYNGGGVPLAFPGSGVSWNPQYVVNFPAGPVVMQGVYIGDGTANSYIDFDIPNWIDLEPVKHFRLQVAGLWSPAPLPSTAFITATDNQPGAVVAQFVGDGVSPLAVSLEFHRYFDWDLFPNPDNETFRLFVPPNGVINQVVIDTISIPEPATCALLLAGALMGMVARRRRCEPIFLQCCS